MSTSNSPRSDRVYDSDEDIERVRSHYEYPAEFFLTVLGGAWHVYSCNIWEGAHSITESQQQKLDLLAQQMQLRPGQRILDVGCGFGGPLVYLAKRYGVRGVGITASQAQQEVASNRASEHGVDAEFFVCHWRNYLDPQPFDAIYSDEAIVHFADLGSFFEHCRQLLQPGGRMVHKELHFATPTHEDAWLDRPTKAMTFLDEFFGETGNYRRLDSEISFAAAAGFEHVNVVNISLDNYQRTAETWMRALAKNRARLEPLVGVEYFRRYRMWIRVVQQLMRSDSMTLDVVTSRAPNGRSASGAPVGE
jgi:cyclopropane-fatty-acyl-phospholipid synthase